MESLSALSLPPGFGFHPTDVELISYYLKRKILGLEIDSQVIPEVDIYKHEPWDLPAKCHVPTRDSKWHFFASRDRKYPNGSRSNRATEAGYWKSTGKDRNIRVHNRVVGTKKTLVFYKGRPPCGKRSDWIMHEYYLAESECKAAPSMKDSYVLCRVTKRDVVAEECETVSPQIEDSNDCTKKPKDVIASGVPAISSSPSDNVDDFDSWLAELFDPNFPVLPAITEVKSEPKTVTPKQEPLDVFPLPEFTENQNLFLPGDDIYNFLPSNFPNYNDFGEFDINSLDAISTDFPCVDNYAMQSSVFDPIDSKADTGIEIRERMLKPATGTGFRNQKIKLQVSKMQSRNGGAVSETVELINQDDRHLDSSDGRQRDVEFELVSTTLMSKRAVISKEPAVANSSDQSYRDLEGMNCLKRIMKGFFSWCSSASTNCFFLGACMMGTAALICYFLLRDARRFLGICSANT